MNTSDTSFVNPQVYSKSKKKPKSKPSKKKSK
jgi:hypothetical protein